MKATGLHLKISDLLKNKITDRINFSEIRIPEFPDLTEEGISGSILLQSLDQGSLLVTLEDIKCEIISICDQCGTSFNRKIHIPEYCLKYVTQLDPEGKDKEEEILLIDIKNGTIDLEEGLYHAIKLEEPFVFRCPACEASQASNQDEREEENYESLS